MYSQNRMQVLWRMGPFLYPCYILLYHFYPSFLCLLSAPYSLHILNPGMWRHVIVSTPTYTEEPATIGPLICFSKRKGNFWGVNNHFNQAQVSKKMKVKISEKSKINRALPNYLTINIHTSLPKRVATTSGFSKLEGCLEAFQTLMWHSNLLLKTKLQSKTSPSEYLYTFHGQRV